LLIIGADLNLGEILRKRGITKFVHFHTDHWEPYYPEIDSEGTGIIDASNRIIQFISETEENRFFSKMSLFYLHPLPVNVNQDSWENHGDAFSFSTINPPYIRRYEHAMSMVSEISRHEFHVHIHHERITKSDYFAYEDMDIPPNIDREKLESERFERYLVKSVSEISRITGMPEKNWAFIHGVWALNASDCRICNIVNEIEILRRNGCFADFSMPAPPSRPVDSKHKFPHTVEISSGPKYYELESAKPRKICDTPPPVSPDRFLIWNCAIPSVECSLDYIGDDHKMGLIRDWQSKLKSWFSLAPVINGTAYIKTHAHCMNADYWEEGASRFYDWPPIMELFEKMEQICENMGVEFSSMTTNEVIRNLADSDQFLQESIQWQA